ncbi:signal peptidase II [Mycoplasmatota bacterium]|nr:signal peptidase II [Mycoplasmatota bacterium]
MVIYILIISGLIVLDQITKLLVIKYMSEGQSIVVIDRFFHLTSIRNTGAAWGNLKDQTALLSIISILSVVLFTYFLFKDGDLVNKKIYTISMLFIVAGAAGNMIDRLFRKEVIDFFDFYIFRYNFPVFNIADVLLTLGMIGFIISVIILKE